MFINNVILVNDVYLPLLNKPLMFMNLLSITKKICQENKLVLSRSRGQNFLVNSQVYDDIVEAAGLSADDVVLEVGPGLGFLTQRLALKAKKVIAVELDYGVYDYLSKNKLIPENVELVHGDALKLDIRNWKLGGGYRIIANLPYQITSRFLRLYLENNEIRPKEMVLMLQKEVAERIAAKPGKMSLLSVSVQFFAQAEILFLVKRENFWPIPEVDSALIRIKIKKNIPAVKEKSFFQMLKFAFSAKRKMIKNNLAGGYRVSTDRVVNLLDQAGISGTARAQDLSLDDWLKLHDLISQEPEFSLN